MLKKVAKVLGLIGGAAAVIWAMRDRLISVATSREPQPPTFRTAASATAVPQVDEVDGIGPVFAKRLVEAGIKDLPTLAQASPDSVAEAAGVSAGRARDWIDQAQQQS